MKLPTKIQHFCAGLLAAVTGLAFSCTALANQAPVYADDEGTPIVSSSENQEYFVTIHDGDSILTVKTAPTTVAEVLERSAVVVAETDIVEPSLDSEIAGNYNINIYRARPALVIDGVNRRYVMTASHDPKQIALDAGLTVYDGDEVAPEFNQNFLEAGALSTYRIARNGGRSITVDEVISYPTETRYDYNMAKGESVLERAGEDGRKTTVYSVEFVDNVEVSRTVVSEEVTHEPVPEIRIVGARPSIAPEQATCAAWAREAGVSDADLEIALTLIYHESGCRVDARNAYSGAYGIPQSLPGNKMAAFGDDWETNPVTQIRWMIHYVTNRYGGWHQAMDWWWAHKWY